MAQLVYHFKAFEAFVQHFFSIYPLKFADPLLLWKSGALDKILFICKEIKYKNTKYWLYMLTKNNSFNKWLL